MPLRLKMKPNELLIINGAAIRNGDRAAALLIENRCRFLRESEIIRESEADTDCKRLCVTLQAMYLVEEPGQTIALFHAQARELMGIDVRYAPYLLGIQREVEARQFYRAIRQARELIAFERGLSAARAARADAA